MRKLAYLFSLPAIAILVGTALSSQLPKLFSISMIGLWLLAHICGVAGKKITAFFWLMIAYMLWCDATYFFSDSPIDTLTRAYFYFINGLFAYCLWNVLRTDAEADMAAFAYIAGCYIGIGATIISFLKGTSYEEGLRFNGAGLDPNDMAFIFAIAIPVAWNLARNSKHTKAWVRFFCYCYPVAALIGLILSASRGGLIDALPGFAYIFLSLGRTKVLTKAVSAAIAVSILAFALYSPLFHTQINRLESTVTAQKSDKMSGRSDIWKAAWNEYSMHPFFGIGSAAIPEATRDYPIEKGETGAGLLVHNTYLEVLAETGLPGILLFVLILAAVTRAAFRMPISERMGWLTAVLIYLIGIMDLTFEFRWQTWIFFTLLVTTERIRNRSGVTLDTAILNGKSVLGHVNTALEQQTEVS